MESQNVQRKKIFQKCMEKNIKMNIFLLVQISLNLGEECGNWMKKIKWEIKVSSVKTLEMIFKCAQNADYFFKKYLDGKNH